MRYKRHYKVAKVLAALTIAFVICWSLFMVTRTLLYFHFTNGGYVWRASQLLILLNTALDPILYGVYGEAMRQYARSLFKKIRRVSCGPSPRQTRKSASNGFTSHRTSLYAEK